MNDENNIELPKRIDEVPNSLEPTNQVNPNETALFDVEKEPNIEQEIISEPETINDFSLPEISVAAGETTNIFNQNEGLYQNNENISELTFEPIPGLDIFPDMPKNDVMLEDGIQSLVTPESPATEEINIPVSPVSTENPTSEPFVSQQPETTEPLNKKIVVEEPVKKEKSKGNPIVGFFALLLILAIILAAFYYFVKMDYIKLPDELKNKLPFLATTTTIKVNNENDANRDTVLNVAGSYLEAKPVMCPDVAVKLSLKDDNTFIFDQLSFNTESNKCDITEITGNYTAEDGKLEMIQTSNPENVISATYKKTPVTVEIKIPVEDDKTIILYDTNER